MFKKRQIIWCFIAVLVASLIHLQMFSPTHACRAHNIHGSKYHIQFRICRCPRPSVTFHNTLIFHGTELLPSRPTPSWTTNPLLSESGYSILYSNCLQLGIPARAFPSRKHRDMETLTHLTRLSPTPVITEVCKIKHIRSQWRSHYTNTNATERRQAHARGYAPKLPICST